MQKNLDEMELKNHVQTEHDRIELKNRDWKYETEKWKKMSQKGDKDRNGVD